MNKVMGAGLLGAIVALGLGNVAYGVDSEFHAHNAQSSPPITSYELAQLPHHFDLSGDAAILEMLQQSPIDPAKRFYATDRRSAEHVLSSFHTIEQMHQADIGLALLNEHGLVLLYSADNFPLMSVMKFHLGYAVLSEMVKRGDRLSDTITIKFSDLDPNTHSPMYDVLEQRQFNLVNCNCEHIAPAIAAAYEAASQQAQASRAAAQQGANHFWGDAYLTAMLSCTKQAPNTATLSGLRVSPKELTICLGDLLYYAVRESDNNACDALIKYYLGGMENLERFWHDKGVPLSLKYTEGEMAAEVARCYDDHGRPYDIAHSYAVYLNDPSLPQELRSFLDETMLFVPTGADRIQHAVKLTLSEYATSYQQEQELFRTLRIFDKTGMGGMNEYGERIAVNDLAFISYEGKPYILSVTIKNIAGTPESSVRDGAMALRKSARVAFTYALNLFHGAQILTPIDLVRQCDSDHE